MIASRLKFLYLDLDHQNFLITKGNFQITGPRSVCYSHIKFIYSSKFIRIQSSDKTFLLVSWLIILFFLLDFKC